MSKTIQSYKRLKLLAGFADEDDRTITVDNPRDGLTKADIQALEPAAAKVIIGDKYGADFSRFKSAAYVRGVTTNITF